MRKQLTAYECQMLDFKIDQWIRQHGELSQEIQAYQTLQQLANDERNHLSEFYQEEIERRSVFIMELMRNI